MSKVKWFKQESAHRQTDGHTCTHTGATNRIISPAMWSIQMVSNLPKCKIM